jgi:2-methylisocitrate lyase-like PEP mutase family enzyme
MAMTFFDLHQGERPLVVPTAWDLPSGLAFSDAGFEAICTSGLGVASSMGCVEGRRLTRQANVALARVLSTLPCYVSIDIEDGYADDPDEVADYVEQLVAPNVDADDYVVEPDVAGIDIADSDQQALIPTELLARKIAAVKARRPELFVNAHVETYWIGQDASVDATIERAQRYVAAGADGIFVPGLAEAPAIRKLAENVPVPLTVHPVSGLSLDDLGALGVRRISTGSLPYRAAIHAATAAASAVREDQQLPSAVPHWDWLNRLVRYGQTAC